MHPDWKTKGHFNKDEWDFILIWESSPIHHGPVRVRSNSEPTAAYGLKV